MTPSLEGLPTKAKEAPSPREVRLAPLDTNPVFRSLGDKPLLNKQVKSLKIGLFLIQFHLCYFIIPWMICNYLIDIFIENTNML